MPGNPFYDLMLGDPTVALPASRAMAEQIRSQQQGSLLGALGSPNAIPAMGNVMGQQAAGTQGLMEKGLAARLHYGQEAQAAKERLEATKGQNALMRAMLAQRGQQDKQTDKFWVDFGNKFNPGIATSRNPLGVNQALLNRVDRIAAIPETTPLENLDKRDMEEIASGVASIVSGASGNVTSRRAVEALVPHTYRGAINQFIEKLKGQPEGLEQQEFAKKFLRLLAREGSIARAKIKQTIAQGAMTYADQIQHPRISGKAARWFQQSGLFDPNEIHALTGEMVSEGAPINTSPEKGGGGKRFTHPAHPGKFFDEQGNEIQ